MPQARHRYCLLEVDLLQIQRPEVNLLLTEHSYHCERYFKRTQVNEKREVLLSLSYD